MKRTVLMVLFGLMVLILAGAGTPASEQAQPPDKAALNRTRKQVKMLDDIYKSVIVAITSKYVKTEVDYPAGRVAIHLFKAINDKGWHEVHLLDVSGKPYNPKNVAHDAFEKEGVKEIKAGKQYFEKVERTGGKDYLRAMTFVPVVLEKCTLCHPNYKDAKKDAAIGAISYKLEIE
jgi:hypothetical protein